MTEANSLKQKKILAKTIYRIFFIITTFCMVLGIASHLKREREEQHVPVTVEDMDIEVTTLKKDTYKVTSKTGDKIDNIQYYDVTIGNEQVRLTEDIYREKIQGNDQITTEIYVFTAKNKQDYLFHSINGNCLKAARFSFLGESSFSDSEIETLTLQSLEVLTDIKYKTLGYKKDIIIPEPFYQVRH